MDVIDGIQIHIFSMPWKRRLPHAKVQIWCVHTLDLGIVIFRNVIQNSPESGDIPFLSMKTTRWRYAKRHFFTTRQNSRQHHRPSGIREHLLHKLEPRTTHSSNIFVPDHHSRSALVSHIYTEQKHR